MNLHSTFLILPKTVESSVVHESSPEKRVQFAALIDELLGGGRLVKVVGFAERKQHLFAEGNVLLFVAVNGEEFL